MALREEICRFLRLKYDLEYTAATDILVTVGGSEAIDMALRCLVGEGDEVIIPEPCFVCYDPLTRMAGGVPGFHRNESGKRIPLDARRT